MSLLRRGVFSAAAVAGLCGRRLVPTCSGMQRRPFYQSSGEDLEALPKPHRVSYGAFKNDWDQLEEGKWPWNSGIRARLPDHYKRRFIVRNTQKPIPVHYKPDTRRWKLNAHGQRERVQNIPIPLLQPKEADEGLWGGEALVLGFKKKDDKWIKPKTPRLWRPDLVQRVLYSEILNCHMEFVVTLRTLDQVDDAYGFDHYILRTHEVDLRSKLGMRLKQAMLQTLINKSMYTSEPDKQQSIYNKYKQYLIPEHEIEWLGLTIWEAEAKQKRIEQHEQEANARPLKEQFAQGFIEELRENQAKPSEEDPSWLSKLNPFKDPKKDDKSY